MSVHQIIYTSCRRGIRGANDGQQVYSYDAGFPDEGADSVKSLFTYQEPRWPGVPMTDELAPTLPRSFTFRRLGEDTFGLALNTYLGRDYMGKDGRFGNVLSHVLTFDRKDVTCYPCEYYGSESLRTAMAFEEVNNPNPPAYLPAPELRPGYGVNVEAVTDFLGEGDRMEVYLNMLCAMLRFESHRKRVVICDTPENIILWIAALEYALPLQNALNLNFTTYEYDPSLSESQICGVLPDGTAFNAESFRQHFVFDLLTGRWEAMEDKDPDFFDFIDTAMSFSYESLADFHRFLEAGYTYGGADEKLCGAYALYAALSDGFRNLTPERLSRALAFADEFARPEEVQRIARSILARRDHWILCDRKLFLTATGYLAAHIRELDAGAMAALKELSVDRILSDFLGAGTGEEDFLQAYEQLYRSCEKCGFSLSTELMRPENRPKLFAVMGRDVSGWKISFIVTVIANFVKDQHLPVSQLSPEAPLGQTYFGIVKSVYDRSDRDGFFLVTRILDTYADNGDCLINMALNLEGMLLDRPDGSGQADSMWKYYDQMVQNNPRLLPDAYRVLGSCRRYDRIFRLYTLELASAGQFDDCRRIYERHMADVVRRDPGYSQDYCDRVQAEYYGAMSRYHTEDAERAKAELFRRIAGEGRDVAFAGDLMRELVKKIPLSAPEGEDARLIQTVARYTCAVQRKPLSGKILLLMLGMAIDKARGTEQLLEKLRQVENLAQYQKADLTRLSERGAADYFDWIVPPICELCQREADLACVCGMMEMPEELLADFMARCARLYLKQCKVGKDYRVFCEFLAVAFRTGSRRVEERLGEVVRKLNRQKTEDLDDAVRDWFREDANALLIWDNICREASESGSGLRNLTRSLGGLFRRRKDD